MSFQEASFEPRFLGMTDNGDIESNNLDPTFKRQPASGRYEAKFHAHLGTRSSKKVQEEEKPSSIFGQKDNRSKVYHQMLFSNTDSKVATSKSTGNENLMTEFFDDSEEDPFNIQQPIHSVPQIPVTKSTPISPRFIINPTIFENAEKKNDINTKSNVLKQNAAMFTFQEGKFSMNDSQIQETWKDSKQNVPSLKLSQKPTSKKSARSPRLLADYKQFATNNSNENNNNAEDE